MNNGHTGPVAFLFPGQGSQHVGMGRYLYENYPETRDRFRQADRFLGFPLSRLCFEGPEEELNRDLNAQLAVYTVSCIASDLLKAGGIVPDAVSGYSSGFYSAAYAAGCLGFDHGLEIVRHAGEILLDEGKSPPGGMAVIFGLPLEKVEGLCERTQNVWLAIQNTPRQTVISGTRPSIEMAMKMALREKALDAYPISVAVAYHSGLVAAGEERFLREITDADLNDPQIPILSYLSLEFVPDKAALKKLMAAQLCRPVSWVEVIRKLGERTRLMVEVGPGVVISRTVMWIDRNIEILNTAKEQGFQTVTERLERK